MKILISWEAKTHDYTFKEGRRSGVNENGTHGELYQRGFDYDIHIFLCSSNENEGDIYFTHLCAYLKKEYQKKVIPTFLEIKNVISIQELQKKLRPLLLKYSDQDVEIFISPGTPAMQTAWYLLAFEFPNIKLFQVAPPRHRKAGIYSKEIVEVNTSNISNTHAVREKLQKEPVKSKDIFKTKSIESTYDLATAIADPYPITTLILGPTGTGKEWIAKHIHKESSRRDKIFLAINCAALNDELLQSRLFGHVKGSFTGAISDHKGAFEQAHTGTLFLDEIGDISKKLQQTLLRVLQDGEVSPMGSYQKKKVDVRIITATNKNLWELAEQGVFRYDLYYRLAVAEIETVSFMDLPMGEREQYFNFFIDKWKRKLKRRKKIHFSKQVRRCIDLHPFPGNFRELENLIQRFYTYVKEDGLVTMDIVPNRIKFPEGSSHSLKIEDIKNAHYKKVYKIFKGNKTKMYQALGIHKRTWDSVLQKLNI